MGTSKYRVYGILRMVVVGWGDEGTPTIQKKTRMNALKCRSTLNERILGPKGEAQDVRNKWTLTTQIDAIKP